MEEIVSINVMSTVSTRHVIDLTEVVFLVVKRGNDVTRVHINILLTYLFNELRQRCENNIINTKLLFLMNPAYLPFFHMCLYFFGRYCRLY